MMLKKYHINIPWYLHSALKNIKEYHGKMYLSRVHITNTHCSTASIITFKIFFTLTPPKIFSFALKLYFFYKRQKGTDYIAWPV